MRTEEEPVQRFSVSLPARLVRVMDELANECGITRSGSVAKWAAEAERCRIERLMIEGYQEMAEESGSRQDSTIMLEQLQTNDQSRLQGRIGVLSHNRMAEVDQALRYSLSFF